MVNIPLDNQSHFLPAAHAALAVLAAVAAGLLPLYLYLVYHPAQYILLLALLRCQKNHQEKKTPPPLGPAVHLCWLALPLPLQLWQLLLQVESKQCVCV